MSTAISGNLLCRKRLRLCIQIILGTWLNCPKGRKTIPNKWVYKIKIVDDIPKYKGRLVAKGYAQTKDIDFWEVFSPVVKMTTLRVLFAIVAALDLELDQMDVHQWVVPSLHSRLTLTLLST